MFEPDSNKLRCNLRYQIRSACGHQGVGVMVVADDVVVAEAIAVEQFVVVEGLPLWQVGHAPLVSFLPRCSTRPERIFESFKLGVSNTLAGRIWSDLCGCAALVIIKSY